MTSASSAPSKPASLGAAYGVIFSGVVAALQIGKLPPALPELSQTLGLSLMQSGFLLSLVQLAGMTLALAVGLSADGLGLKRSMLAGLLVLGFASVMGATADSVFSLMVWRALEGVGFLWVTLPAPGLIRKLVSEQHMRKLLGYWGAYMPAGTALTLLLGPLWLPEWGWRSWWILFAVLTWVIAFVFWRVVPADVLSSVAEPIDAPVQTQAGKAVAWPQRLRETLSAPGPWWVALCFAMYSGQWLAVVGFLPSIYTQAGLSGLTLGLLTAVAAAVNMSGNMASGRLLQRGIHPSVLLACGFLAMSFGALLAFSEFTQSWPWLRYAGVLLFSACGGLVPGTLFSLAVRLAPHERNVSTTVGWMQQGSAAGQFAGPPLVAWLASQVGGWQWTWLATGLCCVVGGVLSVLIARTLSQQREVS
ncbi:CynX/NimT family MFS transporter [Limnohabitans sp. MMS-10A-178]|uniref:MFS transporter n=1 Tax=Limnohabitans sp. MMS-10A-178 TaxID=1835767 RepID=UPI000D38F017|nr:MFS transporter [Limnohabitans sp. MMS-10A-178]PUE16657.1 MFS transporter [Limnohabitans sp. MMS-10A-178]